MHGWGGAAGEYFYMGDGMIKNMLDHMIENGEIRPIIAVSATFYNENSDRDFGASEDALREFHRDFTDHLMPAVEGTFHTYAASTSLEDLAASRDHRAFGGFSLGSVTTWMEFCHDTDYIRYFLPMSGSSWYYGTYGDFQTVRNVDYVQQIVEENGLNERGYFIYHTVGTEESRSTPNLFLYALTIWDSSVKCCSGYQSRASFSRCFLACVMGCTSVTYSISQSHRNP